MSPPKPRVLLVDDYPPLLKALTRLLSPACEVVGTVESMAELMERAARCQPHVVIVDMYLPDGDGLEACLHLRSVAPHAKVIVYTAADDPDLRIRALQAGVWEVVPKCMAHVQLLPAVLKASHTPAVTA